MTPTYFFDYLRVVLLLCSVLVSSLLYSQSSTLSPRYVHTSSVGVEDGLHQSRANDIAIDKQGLLWIITSKGIQYWDGLSMTSLTLPQEHIDQATLSPHEEMGVVLTNKELQTHITKENKYTSKPTKAWSPFYAHSLKTGTSTFYIHREYMEREDENGRHIIPYPHAMTPKYERCIAAYDSTNILVGIDKRLYLYNVKEDKWSAEFLDINKGALLTTGYIEKIIKDEYNNIWIVTVNEGLLKIYDNNYFQYFGDPGSKSNFIKHIAISPSGRKIFAAGLENGLKIYTPQGRLLHDYSHDPMTANISLTFPLDDDTFLMSRYSDPSLYKATVNASGLQVQTLESNIRNHYYQTAVNFRDSIVILAPLDIYHYNLRSGSVDRIFTQTKGSNSAAVIGNKVILGQHENIALYSPLTKDIVYKDMTGLGYIRDIHVVHNDSITMACDKGLVGYHIQKDLITTYLDDYIAYSLAFDGDAGYWVGTGKGLIHYTQDHTLSVFVKEDGLQNLEFNTDASAVGHDGTLYFGGTNGITSFLPNNNMYRVRDPNLYVAKLTISDSIYLDHHFENVDAIELEYNANAVTVDLGLQAQLPISRYRQSYMVEGLSEKWSDPSSQFRYSFSLSPGEYVLKFKSQLPFDDTHSKILEIPVRVYPPWWNTLPAKLLFTILILGILSAFTYLYYRRKLEQEKSEWNTKFKLQEQKINLSRELHDNIGSQLTYLSSSLEQKQTTKDNDLSELTTFSKSIIEDLRSYIWVLNQEEITSAELEIKILDNISRINHLQLPLHIQFECDYMGREYLPSSVAGDLFRVIQELFHNTVKHADARQVNLNLHIKEDGITLQYKDDGKGFDPEEVTLGFGLRGIKKRLHDHGANYTIQTAPDQGYSIEVDLPLTT